MISHPQLQSRRRLLTTLGAAAAAAGASRLFERGVFADTLDQHPTPALTEGPFYPDHLPLDTDNDLLIVNDSITPAVGVITHLSGRILDAHGSPVRNAVIEIWQVDNQGAYIHSNGHRNGRDSNFQGYGRFLTASSGEYYFRTIKPVQYPGRTPHIHVKIKLNSREQLTTQCFIKGEPQNDRDGVLHDISDIKERDLVMADFVAIPDSKIGEVSAKFDIVLGATPRDDHHGPHGHHGPPGDPHDHPDFPDR